MKFSKFMASSTGRILRGIVGVILIALGFIMHSKIGYVIVIVGIVPLAAGIFDFCLFAPLLKMPFSGKAIRACPPKNK
jgi:hypothetical protein